MGEEDVRRKEEERSRDGYTAALLPAEVQAVLTDPAWMCLLYDDVDSAFRTRAIHAEDVQRLCGQLLRAQESLRDIDAASTEDSVHSGISHAGIEESGYSGRVSHASTSSGVPPADQPVLGQEYAGERGRAASSDTSTSEQVRKIEQEILAPAASTNGGGAGGARAGAGAGAGDASPDVTRTCDPEASVASAGGMSFASAADKDTTIKHTDKDTDKDTDTDTDKNTDKDTGKDTDKDRRVSAVDDNVKQDGDSPLEHLVFSWEALYKAHKEGPGGVLGEEEVRVMMEILVGKYSLMLSFLGLLHRLHDTLQQANAPMQSVVQELRRLDRVRTTVRSKGQGWHVMKRQVNGVTYSHLPQMPREPVFFRTHKP